MKTFKDLKFKPHPNPNWGGGIQAVLNFENNYGVSVIQGGGSYTSDDSEYEVAIFLNGELCYDTPITNDVVGHATEEEVSEIMKKVQGLK